jgi:hypothetical protein
MTPQQRRLLCPLTPQTPVQTVANAAAALSLAWPFSIARAAAIGYCETFTAVLDPISLPAACGPHGSVRQGAR